MASGIEYWIGHMRDRAFNPSPDDIPLVPDLLEGANYLTRVSRKVTFEAERVYLIRDKNLPTSQFENFNSQS